MNDFDLKIILHKLYACLIMIAICAGVTAQDCAVTFDSCVDPPPDVYTCDGSMAILDWPIPTASFTGNCGAITVNQTGGPALGSMQSAGTYFITYLAQATDLGDNSIATATCDFEITVVADTGTPVVNSCAPDQDVSMDAGLCSGTVPDLTGMVNATDPEDCPLTITQSPLAGTSFGAADGDMVTITFTIEDGSGNSTTCTTDLTLTDDEVPMIAGCPTDFSQVNDTGDCGAIVTWTEPTVTDNCAGVSMVRTDAFGANGAFFPVGIYDIRYEATDAAGNTAECTFEFQVDDTEDPSITCTGDINQGVDPGMCGTIVTWADPTFSDNCPGATLTQVGGDPSGSFFAVGMHLIEYNVEDAVGNVDDCSFTIIITDDEDPTVTCTSYTRDADTGVCTYTAQGTEFDATFTDNCGATITNDLNGTATVGGETFALGDTDIEWTAEDAQGNFVVCTSTITIEDNEDPVVTCTADGSRDTDEGTCTYTVQGTEFDATFTDNCGGTITNNYNNMATLAGEVLLLNSTTVEWTVDDGNGQSVSCTTVITIEDNEDPEISGCPINIVQDTDFGVCEAVVTWVAPTATDNCLIASFTQTMGPVSGSIFPLGMTTIEYTAVDDNGNDAVCTFTITIEDNEDPIVNCVADDSRDTDPGVCTYTVQGAEFDATFTDNCTSGILTNDLNNSSTIAGEVIPLGMTTVEWTVEDGNGQMVSCTTVITVEDNEVPSITCPADLTIGTDAGACEYTVVGAEFDPAFTDNCTTSTISNDYNGMATLAGAVLPYGPTLIEWQILDGNGQQDMCTFTITVEDLEKPNPVCNPLTITLDATGIYTLTSADINTLSAGSTDNCGINTITASQNNFTCADAGIGAAGDNEVTVMITVTDNAGNSETCDAVVTVMPLTPDGEDQEFTVCSGDDFDFNPEDYITNFTTGMAWIIDYTEDIFVENEYLDGGGSSALGTETITSTAPIVNNSTNTRVLVYTVNPESAAGCPGDPFTVTVNVLPEITATINANGDLELCEGEIRTLLSTVVPGGTYDYTWDIDVSSTSTDAQLKDPSNTDQVDVSAGSAGTLVINLTVTDPASGCVASTDQVTFNVNANPVASISATETEICEGEEVTLTASGGSSYAWSNSMTGASIVVSPLQSTVYQVTATNASGCTDVEAISIIVTPQPVAPQTTDDEVCEDDTTSSLTADCSDNVGLPAEIASESITGLNTSIDGTGSSGAVATLVNIGTLDFTGDFLTGALIDEVTITLTFEHSGLTCTNNSGFTYNNEIVFYLQSSVGIEGYLVNPQSYAGGINGGEVTVTFDANSLNSLVGLNPPVSGTFMPTSAFLGGFNSLSADALTFTLLAGDTAGLDPLCVRGFEATVTTLETGNCQVEWYDALTDGNLVFTGADYDPIANGDVDASNPGDYPFFAACVCDGCPSERTQAILTVNPNPVVSITAQANLCEFADPVFLEATPPGGSWSGTGIINTSLGEFDPGVAGVGTHTITYMSTDGNGCIGENAIDIVVFEDVVAPTFDFCPPVTPSGYTYDAGTNTFTVTVSPAVCQVEPEWINPIATDNCVLVSQTDNVQNFYTPGLYTITYTATDMAGLQTLCSFNFEVIDDTDPNIIGCPSNVTFDTATDECDYEYTWNTPAVNDPCGLFTWEVAYTDGAIVPEALPASGALSSTLSQSVTETFYLGETVVTYTATDGSGNTATCEFIVTVTEDDAPSFIDPMDITLTTSGQMGEDCPALAGFSFAELDVIVPGSTQQFAGVDFTAPSLEGVYPAVGAGGFSDACDDNPELSVLSITDNSVDGCVASFVVTWQVKDANNNVATQDQSFMLTDDEDPTIAAQTDIILNTEDFAVDCPADALSSIESGDVVAIDGTYMIGGIAVNAPVSADIMDNCNAVTLTALTVTYTTGTCSASYEIVWQVDDGCNNSSTTTQTISIVDDSPAVFTEDEPDPEELVLSDLDVDCLADITTVQVNGTDVLLPHTFTASDELTIGGAEIDIPFAEVEDNCNDDPTIKLILVTLEGDSDDCDQEWVLEFTVEDGCNPVDPDDGSYELTILIEDDVAAEFDLDEEDLDKELSADGICPAAAMTTYNGVELEEGDDVDLGDDIVVAGIAVAVPAVTDIIEDCTDLELLVGEISETVLDCSYEITITWQISDGCTDEDDYEEFEQTIIINDTTPATASAPNPVTYTVENNAAVCGMFGMIDLSEGDVYNYDPTDPIMFEIAGIENGVNTADLSPADNCNTVVLTVDNIDIAVDAAPCQNTTITITWIVSDGCNAGIPVDQVFMIQDDQDPTGTTPVGEVDVNSCADETAIDLLIPIADDETALLAAYTDNGCGTVTATFVSQTLMGDDTAWSLDRDYTIVDDCGNAFDVTMTHTGFDDDAPSIDCPANKVLPLSVTCDVLLPDYTAEAVVTDCSTWTVTQVPSPGTPYSAEMTVTVTLTATDEKGNSTDCTFDVSIEDQISPTPVCQNITVQLDASGMVSITAADVDNGSFDACGIDNLSLDVMDFSCANIGDNTVNMTVTDIYGNSDFCTVIVTVEDMVNPMITCPADATIVILDANDCTVDYSGLATISDNCSMPIDIDVTASIVLNLVSGGTGPTGTVTLTNDGSGNVMIDADDLRAGDNVITLTATDANGNPIVCEFTVTVEDTFGPQVNFCPNDITTTAPDGDCELAVNFAQPVFNDPCDNFTISFTHQSGDLFPVGETTTVVWTATDDSGNTAECTFDITVDGNCVVETELTLTYYMLGGSFSPGTSKDGIITIDNIGTGDSELAEVLILKPGSAAFTTTYDDTTTSVNVGVGVTTNNPDWEVLVDNSSFVYLRLKPGLVIPAGGYSVLGLSYNAVGVTGNTAVMEGDILPLTGGDQSDANNAIQQALIIN